MAKREKYEAVLPKNINRKAEVTVVTVEAKDVDDARAQAESQMRGRPTSLWPWVWGGKLLRKIF